VERPMAGWARIGEVLGCATTGWREMDGCTTAWAHSLHNGQLVTEQAQQLFEKGRLR
jgi:hypothetical protein